MKLIHVSGQIFRFSVVFRVFNRLPLRLVLVIPFAIQIMAVAMIIGALGYQAGQAIIAEMTDQMREEITGHIYDRVVAHLSIPATVNHFNKTALEYQQIDVNNIDEIARHFLRQIKFFPGLTYISYTNKEGHITSAFRDFNTGELFTNLANPEIQQAQNIYATDEQGYRTHLVKSMPNFDPRKRIWYQTVLNAGQEIWYPVYKYFSFDGLGVGLGTPIYDSQKQFQGLFTADMSLSKLSEFLRELKIGHSGVAFIIEEDGTMIASSDGAPLFKNENGETRRLKALDMEHLLIHHSFSYLQQQVPNFTSVPHKQQFDFELDQAQHFLQVTPLTYQGHLRWWIMVVMPQADFMQHIEDMTRFTVILSIVAMLISVLIGLWTVRWIVKPILTLSQAAKNLAAGHWQHDMPMERQDELGDLARAFKRMAGQLNISFKTIQDNEIRLKQFLEAMPVGIIVFNPDHQVSYVNQQTIKLLGQPLVIFDNINFYQAGTHTLYPVKNRPDLRALRGETSTVDDIHVYCAGFIKPLEVWGTPIFDKQGQITYAIMVLHDITERKQAEQDRVTLVQEQEAKNAALLYSAQIKEKNLELLRLNQEKNEFLSIVAHDLKNPLSGMLGLSELLIESKGNMLPQELLEYAKMLKSNSENMFQLVTNLLDVNAIELGKFQLELRPFDMLSAIQLLVENYRGRAHAKNIQIQLIGKESNYVALLDGNSIYQVLDNLLSNAIKYSPLGKTVVIRLHKLANEIHCAIQDEGAGLTTQDQQRLFGKFTRLTTQPTGGEHSTGLGLFIVKKLVEAMHGRVWCESELGIGTTFWVAFPRELST